MISKPYSSAVWNALAVRVKTHISEVDDAATNITAGTVVIGGVPIINLCRLKNEN